MNLIEPLINQPKIRPTPVSYDIYYWSTKYFTSEKQDSRFFVAQLAERYASDKSDPSSNLVLATPNQVMF